MQELILQGKLLLASSGKEFIKPTGILSSSAEVKKARKEAMGRLGLEFLDEAGDEMELEKELADSAQQDADVEMENPPKIEEPTQAVSPMDIVVDTKIKEPSPSRSATPVPSPSTATSTAPDADISALSARERNRLKRKRKPGNTAFVAAPPPQSTGAKYNAAPVGGSANKLVYSLLLPHAYLTLHPSGLV